jgi:hypothetical protein
MTGDAPADIWISTSDKHVLKAEVEVPSTSGGKPAKVTIAFSDFGKPFTITPPAQ